LRRGDLRHEAAAVLLGHLPVKSQAEAGEGRRSEQGGHMTPARTIIRIQSGSYVYGTSLPTSDLDFKAVHIPAEDILLPDHLPQARGRSAAGDPQG